MNDAIKELKKARANFPHSYIYTYEGSWHVGIFPLPLSLFLVKIDVGDIALPTDKVKFDRTKHKLIIQTTQINEHKRSI